MKLIVAGFDRDSGNHTKCQSHGVSIAEIEELFTNEVYVAPIPIRPDTEDRFIAIGRIGQGVRCLWRSLCEKKTLGS